MSNQRALSTTAFLTLLAIASMMGANHVAARLAFNHGTDVGTAVVVRSGVTALVLALLLWRQTPSNTPSPRQWRMLLLAGLLVGVQSLCVYSSVARLPVALALLAFNTFPIFAGLWAWLLYRQKPARTLLLAMPVLLAGLALALVSAQGSWQLPQSDTGWLGLTLLTVLYGTGITVLLAVLPRLGVVGNSPILNIEPVVALVLAWLLLGQTIAPVQIAGGLIVVATVMALGLRKR
jgi:drug/metabolite transporter (DMT)-like permease